MKIEKCDVCKKDLDPEKNPNLSNRWMLFQPSPRGMAVEFRVKLAGQSNPGQLCKECIANTLQVAGQSRSYTPSAGRPK